MVFQNADDQLFCPTVAEDVAFGPLNLRLPRHEVESRVKQSLKLMDLEDFEDRVTWKLSEGEKRRVCIASVMAMDPEVLLLDEPTGGLDPENREKLIRIISGCGKGLVLVTHETDLIRRTGARAVLLEEGKLREGG